MIRVLGGVPGFAVVTLISFLITGAATEVSRASVSSQAIRVASFADQAGRGHSTYTEQCSTCHQEDLSGTDMVPALAGSAFIARWDGKTAKDLFSQTSMTMPASSPGSLTQQEYLNVTAYILQANEITPPQDLTVDSLSSVAIHQKN